MIPSITKNLKNIPEGRDILSGLANHRSNYEGDYSFSVTILRVNYSHIVESKMNLKNIRIVLVNTSHPGNIGAAARAMKNMCLDRLYLVEPKAFPHEEATARATGASDLLEQAVVCASLEEAVADCHMVVGASARRRHIAWPEVDPRRCADQVFQHGSEEEVAIVFGREKTGLTNKELDLCQHLVHIPCNADYSSLNVAAAVQVICYELHMRSLEGREADVGREDSLAASSEMEGMYAHIERALVRIGFIDPENPKLVMRRLRRLFNRSAMEQVEVNILRGMMTETEVTVDKLEACKSIKSNNKMAK